jgi:hypothetical protein
MLKKVLFAVVATGFVAALALPVQITPAEAAMTCREAAKIKFPSDWRARHAYRKACRQAWKASHA